MEIIHINNIIKIEKIDDLSATVGNFEAMHIGHLELFKKCISNKNLKSAVITFAPHPKSLEENDFFEINTLEDKIRILKDIGIDYFIVIRFDSVFKTYTKEEFKDLLLKLGVKELSEGSQFHFGLNRSGDLEYLSQYFVIHSLKELTDNNVKISTSNLKTELKKGNIELVNKYLIEPFFITGIVVHGKEIGRKLGARTANISYDGRKLYPKKGIYLSEVTVNGEVFYSITNIGQNPTTDLEEYWKVETHILDFKKNIYGCFIKITLLKYLREEIKFDNVKLLKQQIKQDIKSAKKIIKKMLK